jgi:hypothetical protein
MGARLVIYAWVEAPAGSGLAEFYSGIGVLSGTFGSLLGVFLAPSHAPTFRALLYGMVGFVVAGLMVPLLLRIWLHIFVIPSFPVI